MTPKRNVDLLKRHEERRRQLAELRVTYGNALSDTNLSKQQSWTQDTAYICRTWGRQSHPFSWQLSTYFGSGKSVPRADMVLARRYSALQRQARLQSNFMNHVMRVKAGKVIAVIKN